MMDLKTFGAAIGQIAEDKGISEERILETIELALAAAYKRDYASRGEHIRVKLDPKNGKMQVSKVHLVVDENMLRPEETEEEAEQRRKREAMPQSVRAAAREAIAVDSGAADKEEDDDRIRFNPERHMMVQDAQKIQKGIQPGEELVVELEPHEDFGRIAAQTAKQVIVQRLREVERETVAAEYEEKVGEIVSGIVQRVEGRTIYIDLGRGVGVLFPQEQIPGEFLRLGARIRVMLLEVNPTPRGPQIILSRSHPEFVQKLFEMEVPEIASGVVEIKEVAREAGSRTKIAVMSNQAGVDPIGACVGQRGTRVLTVINELNGEKIDVIEWSEEAERFIANSLAPAKVTDVELGERMEARVQVPDDQLSLAIGREGQNVRLAVKLTKWKIEIEGAEDLGDENFDEEGELIVDEEGNVATEEEEPEVDEETEGADEGEDEEADSDEQAPASDGEEDEDEDETDEEKDDDEGDESEDDEETKKAAEAAAAASEEDED